jgi:UTP--glucose-1-phosphate uridylyltransferase
MTTIADRFLPFEEKLRRAGMPGLAIRSFRAYHGQLVEGAKGFLSEREIEPVATLPDADALPDDLAAVGLGALRRTVLVQLNGGLGSSMGLERAKSLLVVREGRTFLDIVAEQTARAGIPLLLMNSEGTSEDSLAVLRRYPSLRSDLPPEFRQHQVPKVEASTLGPVSWPANPALEWCPPGHGDLYPALVTSGLLDRLLAAGYEHAFVSNVDNLGAVVDPVILGWIVTEQVPFLMEVADRTLADRKGGHLAVRPDGQLVLREFAQCPPEAHQAFQDVTRYRFFNTNNLWLHLPTLAERMQATEGFLGLPLIVNGKTVDPRDPTSPRVYQLETAMGAAISVFPGARAIRVPRTRFAPVKTTSDLLAVRSDAYVMTDDFRVMPNPARTRPPLVVDLDPRTYARIDDFERRIPYPPSLLHCDALRLTGDVRLGRGVVLRGRVSLEAIDPEPLVIPDGAVIEG